jgi:hypothetical protein
VIVIWSATFSGQLLDAFSHYIFDMSNLPSSDVIEKSRSSSVHEKWRNEDIKLSLMF